MALRHWALYGGRSPLIDFGRDRIDIMGTTMEAMMVALRKKEEARQKLVARPQRDADIKAIVVEVTERHSKTLEYLAR